MVQKNGISPRFLQQILTKAHGKIAIALFVLGTGLAKQQLDALHGTCRVYKSWNRRATNNKIKFNQQVGEAPNLLNNLHFPTPWWRFCICRGGLSSVLLPILRELCNIC